MREAEEAFAVLAGWPCCRNCQNHYEPYRHLLDPDTSASIAQWCPRCEVKFLQREHLSYGAEAPGAAKAIRQIQSIIIERAGK